MLQNDITLTSILGVLIIPANKDRYLEITNRPCYGLSFCMDDGCIVYNKSGAVTRSTKNTAVILPMGQSYTLRNEEGGNFPIINFLCEESFTKDFIEIKLKNPEIYLKEFEKLRAAWLTGGDKARLYSLFYGIISRLGAENEPMHPILSKSIRFIYENLSNPNLTNTCLSEKAKVSEVYFRRLFKEHFGTTPKQYILNTRIEEAKRLLSEGISSISGISAACGFSSVYHFSRAFKLSTGMTPTEYERQS
ncbi:MAG: helix-turn-helix transcriptional regulator [Clostridia bacterium]|nr:helix-turn-helix transcriptional regulator [Clostridia bacterium]